MTAPADQHLDDQIHDRRQCLRADLVDLDVLLRSHDELPEESMTWLLQRRELVKLTAELAELTQLPDSLLGFTERDQGALNVRVWRSNRGQPIYVIRTKTGQVAGITDHIDTVNQLAQIGS